MTGIVTWPLSDEIGVLFFQVVLFRLNRCDTAGVFTDLFMSDGSSVSNLSIYSYMDIFTFPFVV